MEWLLTIQTVEKAAQCFERGLDRLVQRVLRNKGQLRGIHRHPSPSTQSRCPTCPHASVANRRLHSTFCGLLKSKRSRTMEWLLQVHSGFDASDGHILPNFILTWSANHGLLGNFSIRISSFLRQRWLENKTSSQVKKHRKRQQQSKGFENWAAPRKAIKVLWSLVTHGWVKQWFLSWDRRA